MIRNILFKIFMNVANKITDLKEKNILPEEVCNKMFDLFWFKGCYMITKKNESILSILINKI